LTKSVSEVQKSKSSVGCIILVRSTTSIMLNAKSDVDCELIWSFPLYGCLAMGMVDGEK
jgi:hypothetical protein